MKPIDRLIDKLAMFERKHPDLVKPKVETDAQKLARFADMRKQRQQQGLSPLDDLTQEEQDFYRKQKEKKTDTQRYQDFKAEIWLRPSSYEMRGLDSYDGQGCFLVQIASPVVAFIHRKVSLQFKKSIRYHRLDRRKRERLDVSIY